MRLVVSVVVAALVALGIAALPVVAAPASAFNGSQFDPGYIISDGNFFNAYGMDEGSIQTFLQQKEAGCTASNGAPCLKDYRETTTTRPAAANGCGAYPGAASEAASTIIAKVGQVCGVNPKVILATLQKESSLVLSTAPGPGAYRTAMGYACPDTAACDTKYYGFFNQVYSAVWQFRQYGVNPNNWNYHVGSVYVQYSPDSSCGGSVVAIRNQATADLYNYTPYQPNQAALNSLGGSSGQSCSSYGNRNFWYFYFSWFGDPQADATTWASLDRSEVVTSGSATSIHLAGWTIDPASPGTSDEVHVYTTDPNGTTVGAPFLANLSRPDVAAAYPGAGPNHGFDVQIPVTLAGNYRTCIYSIRSTGGVLFGCQYFVITQDPPFGSLDIATLDVTPASANLSVAGWTIDPNFPTRSIATAVWLTDPQGQVHGYPLDANVSRPDVGAANPGAGSAHGFSTTIPIVGSGQWTACVYAEGVPRLGANNALLGCRTYLIGPSVPRGSWDAGTVAFGATSGSIHLAGWAFDGGLTSYAEQIQAVVTDPTGATSTATFAATASRPDVQFAFGAVGANHGFETDLPLAATGVYRVCLSAVGPAVLGSPTLQLGCRSLSFGPSNPQGGVDVASPVMSGGSPVLRVEGWTLDTANPSASTSAIVRVTSPSGAVDSRTVAAGGSRPDIAAAFGGAGAAHGYSVDIPLSQQGVYSVCVSSVGSVVFGSATTSLGCRNVRYGPSSPVGSLDVTSLVATGATTAQLQVIGWALDTGFLSDSTKVTVTVTKPGGSSTSSTVTASLSRPDIAQAFPGAGAAHGYEVDVPVDATGSYHVCVSASGSAAFAGAPSATVRCMDVMVGPARPMGGLDLLGYLGDRGSLEVAGWTIDGALPSAATRVVLTVTDPTGATSTVNSPAAVARPDIAAAFPGAGASHGYDVIVPISRAGTYGVCVTAFGSVALGEGSGVSLGCRSVAVVGRPMAHLDVAQAASGPAIAVAGWAFDSTAPTTATSVSIVVTRGGATVAQQTIVANVSRPDVASAFSVGQNHGFSGSIPVASGAYQVCVIASGAGVGSSASVQPACLAVTVP
jgi:hypothetical protein